MNNPTDKDELREKLAAIEHERWADWQSYLHKRLAPLPIGWRMSAADYVHWQRQIELPYSELSEVERQSDRDQVARYWPLIESYIAAHDAAKRAELERELEDMAWSPGQSIVYDKKDVEVAIAKVYKP